MVDQDSEFNGRTYKDLPLGGTESAFVLLAEAFAKIGHKVFALTKIKFTDKYKGVEWKPIDTKINDCDLYIINRAPSLLDNAPKAKQTILWIHNPASYLNKLRNLRRLLIKDIKIVCSGEYHYNSIPRWVKSRSIIIPLGLSEEVFMYKNSSIQAPKPTVIFTSNPERGLLWLVKIWIKHIKSAVPNAQLHIFSGHKTYGGKNKSKIENILNKIIKINDPSIKLFDPIPKKDLFSKLITARSMLYKGEDLTSETLIILISRSFMSTRIIKSVLVMTPI